MQNRHPLDDVQMSAHARARAKADMASAELTIERAAYIISGIRSLASTVKRQTQRLLASANRRDSTLSAPR